MSLIFLMSAPLEVLGVASIAPFLAIAVNPDILSTNEHLVRLNSYFQFKTEYEFMVFVGLSVLVVYVSVTFIQIAKQIMITRFGQQCMASISSRLLESYVSQPYEWFLNQHSAELGKTIFAEVSQVTGGVLMPALKFTSELLATIFIVSFLVIIDPYVALISFLFLFLCFGTIYLTTRKSLVQIGRKRLLADKCRYQTVQEVIGAIKDIKVRGQEKVFSNKFLRPAYDYAQAQFQQSVIKTIPPHIMRALIFGGILAMLLWVMTTQRENLEKTLPLVGLYALAGRRLIPSITQIFSSFVSFRFNAPALEVLLKGLDLNMDRPSSTYDLSSPSFKKSLELKDVYFSFKGAKKTTLSRLNIHIKAGTTTAFVGSTGAGKTTAADIILGLLTPDKGQILVDGEAILPSRNAHWKKLIGYVPQQIFLADDTISANIAFGVAADKINSSVVKKVSKLAKLSDFVEGELPDQYQTVVGERGIRLSGGQRQRIGIARALYHNPELIIMDEATSALDNVTEKAIMDAVHNLARKKTVILIAHRLTTIKACDHIFLLSSGRVEASGTFEELSQHSNTFKKMLDATKSEDSLI